MSQRKSPGPMHLCVSILSPLILQRGGVFFSFFFLPGVAQVERTCTHKAIILKGEGSGLRLKEMPAGVSIPSGR